MDYLVCCSPTTRRNGLLMNDSQALYNIAKVAREDFIAFFPEVFEALFKLCADAERNVQNAAQFLDNLIKVQF